MRKQLLSASPVSLDALNRLVPSKPALDDPTSSSVLDRAPDNRRSDATLLTIGEVAVKLHMSEKSVRRRIENGVIRKAPIGGRLVRVSSDEVARLTAGGLVEWAAEDVVKSEY